MVTLLFRFRLGDPQLLSWCLLRTNAFLSQLNLLWGVKAFYYDRFESTDNTVEEVNKIAEAEGFVKKGDMLINLAAMPIIDKGMVNTLRVSLI